MVAAPPPPHPGPEHWVSRSKFSFSEHGRVAYQIKENQDCSIMVAKILTAKTLASRPWGWGQ